MQRLTVGLLVLLTCGMVMVRRAAEAQPTGKVYRIGCLSEAVWPSVRDYLEALRGLGGTSKATISSSSVAMPSRGSLSPPSRLSW